MSRLIENILKKQKQKTLREFDMTKSGNAMMRHLGAGYPYDDEDNLPIEPEAATWKQIHHQDKICLQKTYSLVTTKLLLYFVNEVIYLSDKINHHPEILINDDKITITLYTHDINDVTDIDVFMSKKIDEIIEDINLINFGG